jgi:hypothetical protein
MDIWEAIGSKLITNSDIAAVCSARVYHSMRPEEGVPCINYFEIGYEPMYNGIIERAHYQVSCRATTPGAAQELARMVCVLFHNFKGTVGTFAVQQATIENKILLPEPETNLYHVPVDMMIIFNEGNVS